MTTQNKDIASELREKIEYHRSEASRLEIALNVIQEVRGTPEVNQVQNPPKRRGKAPKGHLDAAILAVLGEKDPLKNSQIVLLLQKDGYSYPLRNTYVTHALARLHKEKKVRKEGIGYVIVKK